MDRSHINFDRRCFARALDNVLPELLQLEAPWISHWKIANGYTGGKRKVYLRACKWIDYEGYRPRDSRLSMFIKPDKYPEDVIRAKPPRAIQFRSPKYNLMLAAFLKGLEHSFYENAQHMGRAIAKGRNPQQRAADLLEKVACFRKPVFFNSDYSKMDSCVRPEMQWMIFRKFYLKKHRSKLLSLLLKAQLRNVGVTKHGIRYGVRGTRASGDYNTGFENTLINWLILRDMERMAGVKTASYIDGDDAILIVEEWDAETYRRCFEANIGAYGFEVKLKQFKTLGQTPFCQSKLIEAEVPFMARDPIRALSNHNISLKNYPKQVWPRLQEAKMLCEYWSNPGSPVLMPIANLMLSGVKPLLDVEQTYILQLLSGVRERPVTQLARLLYHEAWGISPHEQFQLEQAPALVSCGVKSVTGRTHGTDTFSTIFAKFQALGGDADYGCFSNW